MTKLTLNETISLLLKNNFPLEVIPGTTAKSVRHHLLVIHPELPSFYIVFGDVAHGSLFDAAWTTTGAGVELRLKEEDVRALIEKPVTAPRWTREMPLAEDSQRINPSVRNRDLGTISTTGEVEVKEDGTVMLHEYSSSFVYELRSRDELENGSTALISGVYRFPNVIEVH